MSVSPSRSSFVVLVVGGIVLLISLVHAIECFADDTQDSCSKASTVQGITACINRARDYTSQFVLLANKTFPAGSEKYNQSFKLYADAYSKYGAWTSYLKSALQQGKAKNLNNNQEYQSIAAAASASATAFTNYVDVNTTGESHAVVALLSSLADLGLKLWTGIKKQLDADRDRAATNFASDTKWQTWDDIVKGSPAKSDTSKPTTPTDKKNY